VAEVFGSGNDLPSSSVDVLSTSSDNEDGLFTSDWSLDVRVGLVAQCFDLATLKTYNDSTLSEK
jgi:hypothetical protein